MNESDQLKVEEKRWFVVYTKPRSEKKVSERMALAGLEVYLPLQKVMKQWSDRKKKVELPLIPSVLFVRLEWNEIASVYSIVGVTGVLKYLGQAAIVKDQEIQNLRILLQEVFVDELTQVDIQAGDLVEVISGPFKGMQALAIQLQNSMRLIIEIKNLGFGFSVNVPKNYVKPL
jgi:transcription antitermination factor NusG